MKNFFIAAFLFFIILCSDANAQAPGPCGFPVCPACADQGCDGSNCVQCAACINDPVNGCQEGVPINSHIVFLLVSGAVYAFRFYKSDYLRREG